MWKRAGPERFRGFFFGPYLKDSRLEGVGTGAFFRLFCWS